MSSKARFKHIAIVLRADNEGWGGMLARLVRQVRLDSPFSKCRHTIRATS